MYDPNDAAPMVPMTNTPTTHSTRTDGGAEPESAPQTATRGRRRGPTHFERPPETTGSEADRHREEIEPGAADLR